MSTIIADADPVPGLAADDVVQDQPPDRSPPGRRLRVDFGQEIHRFRWTTSTIGCLVNHEDGGKHVIVTFTDSSPKADCSLELRDATNGQRLDAVNLIPGAASAELDPGNARRVYLSDVPCDVRVSAG